MIYALSFACRRDTHIVGSLDSLGFNSIHETQDSEATNGIHLRAPGRKAADRKRIAGPGIERTHIGS